MGKIADKGIVRKIVLAMVFATMVSAHVCLDGVARHAIRVSVQRTTLCQFAPGMVIAKMVNVHVTIDLLDLIAVLTRVQWDVSMANAQKKVNVCVIMVSEEPTVLSVAALPTATAMACAVARSASVALVLQATIALH